MNQPLIKPAGHLPQEERECTQSENKLAPRVLELLAMQRGDSHFYTAAEWFVKGAEPKIDEALALAYDLRIKDHENAKYFGYLLSRVFDLHKPRWVVQQMDLSPYGRVFEDFNGVVVNLGNLRTSSLDTTMITLNAGTMTKMIEADLGVYVDEQQCFAYGSEFKASARTRELFKSIVDTARTEPDRLDERFGATMQPILNYLGENTPPGRGYSDQLDELVKKTFKVRG